MARNFIAFSGDVNIFKQFTNPEIWKGNLERNIRKATIRNTLYLIKEVKENIRKENFEPNSPLTLATRRNEKPLLDQKNLWNAIDSVLYDSFSAEVGIIRTAQSTGSKFGTNKQTIEIKNLVELMESGYVVTVTEKMRKAIAATFNSDRTKTGKLRKRSRVGLQRLGQIFGGNTYVVPPRPLFSKVFDDPKTEKVIQMNWRLALMETFRAQGAKGGEHRDR